MTFETIRFETDARGVATITLNRPEKHNAMNALMIAELTQAANQASEDGTIKAVVLASEGKTFCAGADLGWMRDQFARDRAGKIEESGKLATMLQTLNTLPKPLIARVQGPAYGGGIGMISVCDIAIVSDTARFCMTETRLGIIPATIGPFVVRKMGEGYARQVFFTTKTFDAAFALKSSLASTVVSADRLEDALAAEIEPILKTMPGAVASAKDLCLRLNAMPEAEKLRYTADALADCWESDEAHAGIGAFLSK